MSIRAIRYLLLAAFVWLGAAVSPAAASEAMDSVGGADGRFEVAFNYTLPLLGAGAGSPVAASTSFLGLIGSRNLLPDGSNNNNSVNAEVGAIAVEDIPAGSSVKIVIPTFKWSVASTPYELGNGSGTSLNVWCSLQYNDGGGQADIGDCTFSGSAMGTVSDDSYIVSDAFVTTKTIHAGDLYKTRILLRSTSSVCASGCFVDVGGGGGQSANKISNATYGDVEVVGPSTMNNLANGSLALTTANAGGGTTRSTVRTAPSFLLSLTHRAVIIAGDSISAGVNGTLTANARYGDIAIGISANAYAVMNFGSPGGSVACWRYSTSGTGSCGGTLLANANYATNRISMLNQGWANNLVNQLGTNDKHLGGNSLATIETDYVWLYGQVPVGTRIIQATITWKTTSSADLYTTAAGQTTLDPAAGVLDLLNTDIRTLTFTCGAPCTRNPDAFFDPAGQFENQTSPSHDGKWAVNGTNNWCTTDGVHPNDPCYALAAAGIDVTKFKTNVIFLPVVVWRRRRKAANDNGVDQQKEAA